jgi:sugar O-acyltransferase (sialic acid O-acetyltransferase NeuD family)
VTATHPLLLVGAGGLGRETVEAVRAMNAVSPRFEVIGFLDDDPALANTSVDGVPVVGRVDDIGRYPSASVVVCTAGPHDPSTRLRIVTHLGLAPSRYATVIHPTAVLPAGIEIGHGCIVLASVVATTAVRIGAHTVVMPAVVFAHDDVIGNYATFGAGVHLAGRVRIGEGAYLGAGALVRENTVIGRWAVVGMGAVVTDDVPDGEVWVGVPARLLRNVGGLPDIAKAASDG